MKSARFKDFIREIKDNKGRFLSIFFIVLLGAAFFAGIRSTGGDMKYSADVYYDKTKMMDIRVLSTLGLTEDDLTDISNVPGVQAAEGGHTQEVLLSNGTEEYAVKVIQQTRDINLLTLSDGREPEAADECVMDVTFLELSGFAIGDTITLLSGTDDPLTDTLTETEFTIVGTGYLPYYMEITRGTGSIGDGQLDGFLVVSPDAFDMDYYSEIYVRTAGTEELNTYSDAYTDAVKEVTDGIEDISEAAKDRRYEEIYSEAEEKTNDAQQDLDDARAQLADAKAELDDGWAQLEDAKLELDDGAKELADGKAQLDDAKTQLDDGWTQLEDARLQLEDASAQLSTSGPQLDSAKAQLDTSKAQLDSAKAQLDSTRATLDSGQTELAAGQAQIDSTRTQLEEGKAAYEAGLAQLETKKAELAAAKEQCAQLQTQLDALSQALEQDPENAELLTQKEQLTAAITTLEETLAAAQPEIDAAQAQLDAAKAQLDEGEAQLAAGEQELEASKAKLAAGEEAYAQGLAQYNSGYARYEEGLAQYNSGRTQYEEGLAQYNSGRAQYEEGLAQYNSGRAQYEEGLAEYTSSMQQYADALAEYQSGLAEYESGKAEYEDGLAEWEDGNEEYETAYADAQPEIADAQAKIDDAKDTLKSLSRPDWYILDRDKIESAVSYGTDAERMDSLGNVFPVIFFLVAALVSLNAMTRMVEDQRMQIGTMKALGYGGGQIAAKYLGYALLATAGGAFIGIFFGEKFLPEVIISSYGIMYVGLPEYFTPINWTQGLLAVVIAILCTGLATLAACYRNLKDKPAQLMRPEAPKSGKRIFLEYLSFIWKRLNFTQKSTMRNLFRYKKRFIMTIIGISGCMGLMLVGYGIRDSIAVMAENQYTEIFRQTASVTVDTGADDYDIECLQKAATSYDGIEETLDVCQLSVTLQANNTDRSAYIYVPEETDRVTDFVRFRDRISKEGYDFPTQGAALTEKAATMLGVSVGDTVTIQEGEGADMKTARVEVACIVENYVQHYIFLSPETYTQIFGEEPEYNFIYLKYADSSASYESDLGTTLLKENACSGISFTTDLVQTIDDMLAVLDFVIWVLIAAAALLAFVVLYNLNSINMTERRRELATLKVLGFDDLQVAMYIYRENIILTLFGVVGGAVLGTILHLFTILTVEVDLMMFGRVISTKSYLICAAITLAFSLLVNLAMFSHFKKIDMIESLKSVE